MRWNRSTCSVFIPRPCAFPPEPVPSRRAQATHTQITSRFLPGADHVIRFRRQRQHHADQALRAGREQAGARISPSASLAANEAPMGASPKAIEAAQGLRRTAEPLPRRRRGCVCGRKIGERFGFPAEQLICGAGSDEIIALICQAFTREGGEVLYSQHGFLMYKISALAAGARPPSQRQKPTCAWTWTA